MFSAFSSGGIFGDLFQKSDKTELQPSEHAQPYEDDEYDETDTTGKSKKSILPKAG